jgi:hypothetical protein
MTEVDGANDLDRCASTGMAVGPITVIPAKAGIHLDLPLPPTEAAGARSSDQAITHQR